VEPLQAVFAFSVLGEATRSMAFKTQYSFRLPRGYVDEEGNVHRDGVIAYNFLNPSPGTQALCDTDDCFQIVCISLEDT